MILKMMEAGPLMVNCYIVGDEETGEAAVFDPGGDADKISKVLEENGLKAKYIINTHTHWDHVGGNGALQKATGAPILTHRLEADGLAAAADGAGAFGLDSENSEASRFVEEGDVIEMGSISFEVIDLRGHSPAGLGFVFEGELEIDGKNEKRKMVICGDALFAGSIGRTDFPGGDMALLLDNIRKKIFTLPDDTLVLPGHGPVSMVGREKTGNPFF
ncbi:MAG: MBL fold metallo-hydrolase [Deltaproteobacteria bacterium]|nr:MBL fold metallo-hydrolase [Deltaproteobacteria bacterium]MBW1816883.1 MBL fold metallo-hydrolase [Deltaproteobacteria bacterium]MBW2285022.1 MBL fold metallo-hydrolase [Deltaproteobacteria bacterium]